MRWVVLRSMLVPAESLIRGNFISSADFFVGGAANARRSSCATGRG